MFEKNVWGIFVMFTPFFMLTAFKRNTWIISVIGRFLYSTFDFSKTFVKCLKKQF